MADIERIKKEKIDREERKNNELQKLRLASARKKKRLKDQIEKRKIELGIVSKHYTVVPTFEQSGTHVQKGIKTKQVSFINLEEEEERDRHAVGDFMKKYSKLWRNIFAKYQNQGYKV